VSGADFAIPISTYESVGTGSRGGMVGRVGLRGIEADI